GQGSLYTYTVHHKFSRLHVEGHLPCSCFGLLCPYLFCLQFPESIFLKEIMKQRLYRVWRYRLKFLVKVKRGRKRRLSGSVLLQQISQRTIHAVLSHVVAQGIKHHRAFAVVVVPVGGL